MRNSSNDPVVPTTGYTLSITDAYCQPEVQTRTYEWQANTYFLLSVTDALNRKTAQGQLD
jgi:hypothetical protein